MQFQYEIQLQDYVAACRLWHKLSGHRRRAVWFLVGAIAFLTVVAIIKRAEPLAPVTPLFLLGLVPLYQGAKGLTYPLYVHRYFAKLGGGGETYTARLDPDWLDISGKTRGWRLRWEVFSFKAEDDRVFVLYDDRTLYIFAKRYLSPEDQQQLRHLAGMSA